MAWHISVSGLARFRLRRCFCFPRRCAGMLEAMQQPATATPSPTFAGMLASLAAPGQKRPPARDLDGLEDDVATLSYERALRAHGRYRAPAADDRALALATDAGSVRIFEAGPMEDDVPAPAVHAAEPAPEAAQEAFLPAGRNLKCASITIRVSKSECEQLRKRAAEAGLTVSAYMRSCTFEAESLRAMVKVTMAELRAQTAPEAQEFRSHTRDSRPRISWFGWLRRLWPVGSGRQQIARA